MSAPSNELLRELLVAILRKEPRQARMALMAACPLGDMLELVALKCHLDDWIHSSLQALSQRRAPSPPPAELKRIAKALLDHHFPG